MTPPRRHIRQRLVIGLDSSTTAAKAIAFDEDGNVVAAAHEPIPLFSPGPNRYEQHAEDWWSSTHRALKRVARQGDPKTIDAVAISNQRETFVPLDQSGASLRPAILWLDERCKEEVSQFARTIGETRIHRITGKPVDFAPVVYRLAWMKKHEPVLFGRIGKVCDVQAFLVNKLVGLHRTSWASADPFGMFDLRTKQWSRTILGPLGLRQHQLADVFPPGAVLGNVTAEASSRTGLDRRTLVIAGGGDGQAAGTGANVLAPGLAYLNLGTAVVAGVFGSRYRTSRAFRTLSSCSDSGYYYECSLRAGTFAIDWFVKKVLRIDPQRHAGVYAELEREARSIPAGSNGLLFLPYLSGAMNPYWDVSARGAFTGLSSAHTRGHMYRAILEGIAFEQRLALDAVERSTGIGVRNLVAIGGGATSALWCRIIADATGRTIRLPRQVEASALGAAIAASVGAGWHKSFRSAARHMTGHHTVVAHGREARSTYHQLFRVYKALYPALKRLGAGQ